MLEANLHSDTGFLTLTYADEHLPENNSLCRDHLKKFWKDLRNYFPPGSIRAFSVGEYGHEGVRRWNPHYHAALYGLKCHGPIQRAETWPRCHCKVCERIYSVWGKGNISLDELNPTTAAYIGGYVIKKMTKSSDHRLEGREPEFPSYPTRPGLAGGAVEFVAQTLQSDFGHLAFVDGDIPHQLYHGGRSWPLGRYLKTKIRQRIDLYKVNPETGEVTYGTPHETLSAIKEKSDPEMSVLLADIRNSPSKEKYKELDNLKAKSVSRRNQKVLNAETKFNIYRKAKTL